MSHFPLPSRTSRASILARTNSRTQTFRSAAQDGGVSLFATWDDLAANGSVLPQTKNPNCITNAIPSSRLTTAETEMIVGEGRYDTDGVMTIRDAMTNEHDGIHILHPEGNNADGTPRAVTALPAMAGTVLHYGPQNAARAHSNLDIRLNARLNGEPLVLTLKDMRFNEGAFRPGQPIVAGQQLGLVDHSFLLNGTLSEGSGLHVTLMTLSTYRRYVTRRGISATSRKSVPSKSLIDAYNDPRSPFRCP